MRKLESAIRKTPGISSRQRHATDLVLSRQDQNEQRKQSIHDKEEGRGRLQIKRGDARKMRGIGKKENYSNEQM